MDEVEIWKPVKGFEEHYEVSSLGNVRSKNYRDLGPRLLRPKTGKQGYMSVCLQVNKVRKFKRVHRLVAEAYIDNPFDLKTVNHINGSKKDNRVENLEWMTHSDNVKHAYRTHLASNHGLNHSQARLTNEEVTFIFLAKYITGIPTKFLVSQFGITAKMVRNIQRKKNWTKLTDAIEDTIRRVTK